MRLMEMQQDRERQQREREQRDEEAKRERLERERERLAEAKARELEVERERMKEQLEHIERERERLEAANTAFYLAPERKQTRYSVTGADIKPLFGGRLSHLGTKPADTNPLPATGLQGPSTSASSRAPHPDADQYSAARASIKPPRQYTAKMRFEDWWSQFKAYLFAVAPANITEDAAANHLISALSPEVFATIRGCGLTDADLLSMSAIHTRLQSRFGDRITPALYLQELPQLKQGATETAATFTDRVRQIAHRAYPDAEEDQQSHRNVVLGQLLVGLRSAEVKRALQTELRMRGEGEPPSPEELYLLVRRIEDDELRATGKQVLFGSNSRADNSAKGGQQASNFGSNQSGSDATFTFDVAKAFAPQDPNTNHAKPGQGPKRFCANLQNAQP